MQPEVANNSEDFEVLAKVFLDPLLRERLISWLGIFERIENRLELRTFRGPFPDRLLSESPSENLLFDSNRSSLKEKISFGNESFGFLYAEDSEAETFSKADKEKFVTLGAELGALFAWKDSPWSARLAAVKLIYDLKKRYPIFDWIGIYRLNDSTRARSQNLLLSSFLGVPTPHINIPVDKGICGAAIREARTLNIPNVREDPRFLACSLKTKSELVVPIYDSQGKAIAEIDIDSDRPNAFTPERIAAVESCAQNLGGIPELFANA